MLSARLRRVRVLDALERLVKQFRTHETLHPLRVPHEPLDFTAVTVDALGDEGPHFDPRTLQARVLLSLEWPDGSAWDAWVIVLPSKTKLYCDTGDDESRILASGGRNEGDQSDRLFLELFGESRGALFGVEMSGGLPSRVRTSMTDRDLIVDVFVNLFEGTEVESALVDARRSAPDEGFDLRDDVDRWLLGAGVPG